MSRIAEPDLRRMQIFANTRRWGSRTSCSIRRAWSVSKCDNRGINGASQRGWGGEDVRRGTIYQHISTRDAHSASMFSRGTLPPLIEPQIIRPPSGAASISIVSAICLLMSSGEQNGNICLSKSRLIHIRPLYAAMLRGAPMAGDGARQPGPPAAQRPMPARLPATHPVWSTSRRGRWRQRKASPRAGFPHRSGRGGGRSGGGRGPSPRRNWCRTSSP